MNLGPIKGALLAAASAAVLLAGCPGGAAAGTAGLSGGGTPQCAAGTLCVTPVLYGSQPSLWLGTAVTAAVPNAPVIAARIDPSDPGQDWTLERAGGLPPGAPAWPPARAALGSPRVPAPQLAALEYSPGGIRSDLCAANVADRLVLRHCNGSNWQLFLMTSAPAGGGLPPGGWSYFVSNVQAGGGGRHLAMASAHFPGAQITFAELRYISSQWWRLSGHCLVDLPRSIPRARRVC